MSLKNILKSKKTSDRAGYDEDVEGYKRTRFLRFYSALGCIHLPKRTKYNPNNFTEFRPLTPLIDSPRDTWIPAPGPTHLLKTHIPRNIREDDDLEVIVLGEDISPNPAAGNQWDRIMIAFAWV